MAQAANPNQSDKRPARSLPVLPLDSTPVDAPRKRQQVNAPAAETLSAIPVAALVSPLAAQAASGEVGGTAEEERGALPASQPHCGPARDQAAWKPNPILPALLLVTGIAAIGVIVYCTEFADQRPVATQVAAQEEPAVPSRAARDISPQPAAAAPPVAGNAIRPGVRRPGAGELELVESPAVSAPPPAAAAAVSAPHPNLVAIADISGHIPLTIDAPPSNGPAPVLSGTAPAPPAKAQAGQEQKPAAAKVQKAGGPDAQKGSAPKEKPLTGWDEQTAGAGLDTRAQRRQDARRYGATSASEAAVETALKWLAVHQMPDGGWCFNHQLAPYCHGQCRDPGRLIPARIAATALGLLPFLGAGQTYQDGRYQQTVRNGLLFLTRQMVAEPAGGCLCDRMGGMYGHGLAAIALCEAYGMTAHNAPALQVAANPAPVSPGDKKKRQAIQPAAPVLLTGLRQAAQASLVFISSAEDPLGGGWRYQPRMAGDTSVLGWQMMALCSGRMSYLTVDPRCFEGARHFLDSVEFDSGANYGYKSPDRFTMATQAIGLLCRMYLGWKHDHPALQQGVQALCAVGPSNGNMYYNYYATQVLHHYGGERWNTWNNQMRDMLVASQARLGHEAGSWFFSGDDKGDVPGGRLYITALAAMTLEVYYRHLPLYRESAFQQENKP